MNTRTSTKTFMYRAAAFFMIAMMLFAALPVAPAAAVSLNITSVATGTWEATAWPNTLRSGTITVTAGNTNVVGTGTAFLTELSVGNIIKTATNTQIGTVAAITSNTNLTLKNIPATNRTNIAYNVQGVGPADNVTIADTHNVTIAANPINQIGTVTVNAGGTLTVSDAGAIFSTLTVAGTVTGTTGNDFGALTVNNGGLVTAGTNGTYTAASLTINSGGTLNISRAFTVNGATSITGAISFSSTSVTSRAMVFKGPVTLNGGATWTEPASGNGANNTYDFQHNFTNNASTFTASDTTTHTFSGAGRTIGGTTTTSIARVRITGTYTNNGTLMVGTLLSGTGGITNGIGGTLTLNGTVSITTLANAGILNKTDGGPITIALANFTNTGTLNLNGTGTITGITNNAGGIVNLINSGSIAAFDNATATSTLNILDLTVPHFGSITVSATGNTVNYSGAGDQTVKSITYSNLVFSGSGTKFITMPGDSTLVSGNLSVAPTGTAKAGITGPNLTVSHLSLAGAGKASGTWGSSGSAATNQDDNFFAAASTGHLNVTNDTRLAQTITFTSTAPVNATVGGSTYTPTATGGASGNPVTFTIDGTASSVCSISLGVVSFIGNGTCVIDANQAGDLDYLAATQQQSFDVKTGQTINFTSSAPVSAVVGGSTYTPTATATSGLTVTFTIDAVASSVCSISAGVVSFDEAGTCVIDADQAGDNDYHAAPQVQQSFTVGKGAQTISFTSTAPVGAVVGGATYTPTATATSDLAVAFTIDATASSVCSISAGVVSFNGAGNCVINANQPGNAHYNAAPQVQQSFGVTGASYWLPWYNNATMDTQLRFGNISGSTATVHVFIGGAEATPVSGITIPAGGSTRVSYAGVNNGPVKVVSNFPIVVAERHAWLLNGVVQSFSEMAALPGTQVTDTYYFPWYNNVTMDTQLRFANLGNTSTDITVTIAGVSQLPITVAAGQSTRVSYAGINSGPVKVQSSGGTPIIVAERDAWLLNGVVQSYSEMMGLPSNQLTDTYYFPWYNNVTMDTQLRFANLGAVPTDITVTIAGIAQTPITVGAGQSTRVSYTVNNGPVKVQSSGGTPIIVAERDAWLINGVVKSFSEMMGLPGNQLTDVYYFPWYNNVTMDTQLRFANLGVVPTDITVTIAGVAQTPITVAPGTSTRISYTGINDGPVTVTSSGGVPIIVAERDAWLLNGIVRSFSEMMGLPGN